MVLIKYGRTSNILCPLSDQLINLIKYPLTSTGDSSNDFPEHMLHGHHLLQVHIPSVPP